VGVMVSDLILHVGMQQSGATMLQRALSRLRPQLRMHGIVLIGHKRISQMEHLAGWRARPDAVPALAATFECELADVVMHELKRIAEAGGQASGVVVVASDHLLGAPNLDAADEERFRPLAVDAIAQVIHALGADDARVVLHTHRQDRLMELCYQREIRSGRFHRFDEQFPNYHRPLLDYNGLIARLQAVPQVNEVLVRPFELAGAGPRPFVDDFLSTVGLRGGLDLDPIGDDLAAHHVYSRRGLKIALGMNPHLDTDKDRRLVRTFLLEHFAATDDRQQRFLPKRVRREILAAYTDVNRELFRAHMPELPHDSYDDNAATSRLGVLLDDTRPAQDRADAPRHGGGSVTATLPLLLGGRRRGGPSLRGRRVPPQVADAVARLADRIPLLYRAKVRLLARRCDVFIVSFPKCGRTWLRMQLGSTLTEHHGLRVRNLRRLTDADVWHPGLPRILATHDDSPQGKRPHRVMRDKRAYDGSRVILLVRDPRDVMVSLYFHVTRRRGVAYAGDVMDFMRERTGGLASLLAFYDAWAPRVAGDDVLLLRYEDMHADPTRELQRVLAFLGMRDVASDVLRRAVQRASFDHLQQLERAGTAGTRALHTASVDDPESYKVRRGKVGGHVDYLEPEDVAAIDRAVARSAGARAMGYVPGADSEQEPRNL